MAADRLAFLDPAAFRALYPSALHNEFLFRSPGNLFSNVQFIPERVSQFSISPDGVRYYKVHWQETWLAEHQLLQYQNLIEGFWRNQSDLSTSQSASSTPTPTDIIKPRKDTNNESFLSALQSDSVDLSTPNINIEKASSSIVNQVSQERAQNAVNESVTASTDILKEAVLSAELNTNIELNLPNQGPTIDISVQDSSQSSITTPKLLSPTARRSSKNRSINLEGFDLVNIENTIATVEELEAQARETLSSFRRKRVRFPNGTSKLPQTCFFCLKTISNRKKLREHQFGVHFKNVGEFVCGICQQRFVFRRQLKAHMITHSDNRNYVCKVCGLTCKRRSHLHKHMDTHKKERNYRCDVCHKNFKVQAELKDHCLGEHKNEVSKCNVCKQTLHTAFSVYIHSMRHSGTRDHVCETCGASFKRKQHLNAHVNIHTDAKDKIKCPACDKEFPERQYFRKHLEIYHKDLVADYRYDYICQICGKDFAYKGRLDAHMQSHENETVEEREARLRKGKVDSLTEDALEKLNDRIEKVVDEKTGNILMRCKLCRKREFRMIASMERHLDDHKCGRIFMKVTGGHECDVCKKTFHTESRLARHTVIHQSNRLQQHQCRRCKKFFKWKSCLQVHAKKCMTANKGAEKRKATLKAKEKLRRQLRQIQSNDSADDSDSSNIGTIDVRRSRRNMQKNLSYVAPRSEEEFREEEEEEEEEERFDVDDDENTEVVDEDENSEETIVVLKVNGDNDHKSDQPQVGGTAECGNKAEEVPAVVEMNAAQGGNVSTEEVITDRYANGSSVSNQTSMERTNEEEDKEETMEQLGENNNTEKSNSQVDKEQPSQASTEMGETQSSSEGENNRRETSNEN